VKCTLAHFSAELKTFFLPHFSAVEALPLAWWNAGSCCYGDSAGNRPKEIQSPLIIRSAARPFGP
jgi:hypothetical protein